MIEIQTRRGASGLLQEIEVQGHAGLAAAGSDVLCAAVSVLMESLEQGLALLLQIQNQGEKQNGYHRISIKAVDLSEQAALLMSSTLLGLQALAVQYPDRIQLQSE